MTSLLQHMLPLGKSLLFSLLLSLAERQLSIKEDLKLFDAGKSAAAHGQDPVWFRAAESDIDSEDGKKVYELGLEKADKAFAKVHKDPCRCCSCDHPCSNPCC